MQFNYVAIYFCVCFGGVWHNDSAHVVIYLRRVCVFLRLALVALIFYSYLLDIMIDAILSVINGTSSHMHNTNLEVKNRTMMKCEANEPRSNSELVTRC